MAKMAPDFKESDTDEGDRPVKKQKTAMLSSQISESAFLKTSESSNNEKELIGTKEDKKPKLQSWQFCQLAKGVLDNTINSILEHYRMSPPDLLVCESETYPVFDSDSMEASAISMAIQQYGLIRSIELNSPSFEDEKINNVPKNSIYSQAPVVTAPKESAVSTVTEATTTVIVDKFDDVYNIDYHKDFLDRAVGEAIKARGLCLLSVDYG